jgi:hypothetical protein
MLGTFGCPTLAHAGLSLRSASLDAVDSLVVTPSQLTVRLSHQFIVSESETLTVSGTGVGLRRGRDYVLDNRQGEIQMDSAFVAQWKAGAGEVRIIARYRYLPFRFQDQYSRRVLVPVPGGEKADSITLVQPQSALSLDDIFGSNVQKSGSIVRGITVGSNRDFSVNSGLRLQLSGRISQDVDVTASLTDENTPIQPEGTTQTLQEFDRVFVEIAGREFNAVLGDFVMELDGSEFARFTRKLQGAKGAASLSTGFLSTGITASGAVPRGKFHTNQIEGLESVQGPYALTGQNGEREIIVIAGTERVFVDGVRMVRGETNDYTIDYSLGEITFTPRRLITTASRLTIDFEYSDRQYSRTLIAAKGTGILLDGAIDLGISFVREQDNKDDPLDAVLGETEREILAGAGDHRDSATVSGLTAVDSNGFYVRVDTLVAGDSVTFYRYAPGPSAQYVITFSSVGTGRGDYVRVQPGVFEWRGTGGGDYLPVRFLPLPSSHDIIDYTLKVKPLKDLMLTGEFAQSVFDANTFSSLDDDDNDGRAFDVRVAYTPEDLRLFGASLGGLDAKGRFRSVSSGFVFLDRVNEIEFSRKWGVDTLRTLEEKLSEISLRYLPTHSIVASAGTGNFRRGDVQRSTRRDAAFSMRDEKLPSVEYYIEEILSRDGIAADSSSWVRQKAFASYGLWKFSPMFRYEQETRRITSLATGTLLPGSLGFNSLVPGLRVSDLGPLSLFAEYEWRSDDAFDPTGGTVQPEAATFTQSYRAALAGIQEVSASLDLTLRKREVQPLFAETSEPSLNTVLVRNQTRYAPQSRVFDASFYYQVSTQRSSAQQRLFVRVTPGTGNYRYLGDLNGNGIADASEFEQTRFDGDFVTVTVPTSDFLPIIDLNTSLRLALFPRFLSPGGDSWFSKVLSFFSTESYFRIDEKSTTSDQEDIYLLHLSQFLNDSTTIAGSQLFTQDVNLFEQTSLASIRLRYSERKSLTRYTDGVEDGYTRERSARLRLQLLREFSQQIDVIRRDDRAEGLASTGMNFDILSTSLLFDISYRPEQNIEFGLKVELTGSSDRLTGQEVDADINSEGLRFVYSFQGVGQARIEGTREEVILSSSAVAVPYELTGGRVPGKTWLWRGALDYRVAQFVQTTVSYDGRVEGGGPVVHTGRAEVRAFF